MKILLLYTTREKQTHKIMQRIQSTLERNHDCDLIELVPDTLVDLSLYQAALLASSIRYGAYSKVMKQFIDNNFQQLNQMPSAFFGVNLVARKPNKNTPETNTYTRKFLTNIAWQPTISAVFAGALYYPKYNWLDKTMIRFIMWLGKGETDTSQPVIEYTNWDKVDDFALTLHSTIFISKQTNE